MNVSLAALRDLALQASASAPEGEPLDAVSLALIDLGAKVSVTALEPALVERTIDAALAVGASSDQIQEVLTLVSGLGVHSLMVAMPLLMARTREATPDAPLDPERQALWDAKVGSDPYWTSFEAEVPGFLDALIRLAPATFRAFFEYNAVPWQTRHVRARTKELVALACDCTPTHRFLPGFRLHLKNALALGVGRRAILETLTLAASQLPSVLIDASR